MLAMSAHPKETQPRDNRLVWIDLEMTGLNPERNVILEIATLVTDSQLNLVADLTLVVHQNAEELENMVPVVRDMHARNGLTEAVRGSAVSCEAAEQLTLDLLRQHCQPGTAPLCGNTVWTDRVFLQRYMPQIDAFLHYRVIDVSTLKELARRWHPQSLATMPPKPETHRALDDIRASIDELRHYRSHLLRVAGNGKD